MNKDKIIDNCVKIFQQMEKDNDEEIHSKEEWLKLLEGDLKDD